MQHLAYIFFSDDPFPKDDVDKLFEKLEQVEPPPALIVQILQNIPSKQMPPPPADSTSTEADPWDMLDGLVVRKEKLDPS